MSETITCPSGVSGRIRGMKVREERILTDRKLAKSGEQVDRLMDACWEDTLDPGPSAFGEKDIDWSRVVQGDRFFMPLQLLALTFGPEYAFAVSCQNDACSSRIEWELNLHDIPTRPLSPESSDAFVKNYNYECIVRKKDHLFFHSEASIRRLPRGVNLSIEKPVGGERR